MAMGWENDMREHAVTDESLYLNRRAFLAGLGAGALAVASPLALAATAAKSDLEPNTWEDITSYNNYYEFGTSKGSPKRYAGSLTTKPWTVTIDGMVDKPGDYQLEDLLAKMTIEERIYRFRCVEAWSMVIPFNGFELRDLLAMVGVQSDARYVAFQTLHRPKEMPGLGSPVLDWPYREGLRLDEAMHPLSLMVTGIYGRDLPNQNGAPLRLAVPWKYGFKSIKSIVKISLVEKQPFTSWNDSNSREYGFYSNVNPQVDHPRWSQATERHIGGGVFAKRQPTKMFNGYTEVAGLYTGMDLTRNF